MSDIDLRQLGGYISIVRPVDPKESYWSGEAQHAIDGIKDQGFEVVSRADLEVMHTYMEVFDYGWTPEDRQVVKRIGHMLGKPGYEGN